MMQLPHCVCPSKETVLTQAKVLIVGAGGIGCELLKMLVLSHVKCVTIVDMDKIEKSNLNRQFLFTEGSIGKYKSTEAVNAIMNMHPNKGLNINAYVGNIKDKSLFPDSFFMQYHLVLNALDNLDARFYINAMCIKLNIPFVNSGSEGYLGHISCHIKGKTPCYNCTKKNKSKAIPICTIKLKPETIEHCIAWGKALFEKMFMASNKHSNDLEDNEIFTKGDSIDIIAHHIFYNDIHSLKMTYDCNSIEYNKITPININDIYNSGNMNELYEEFLSNVLLWNDTPSINKEHYTLDMKHLVAVFVNSYKRLKSGNVDEIIFDKENDVIINFIYASCNLRAINFNISPLVSKIKTKHIAGNIIPAIASTNNIVAAIQVMEGIKIVMEHIDKCKNVFYVKNKNITSTTSINEVINKNCPSECYAENIKRFHKEIDFATFTISDFITYVSSEIVKEEVKDISINIGNTLVYETIEDDNEEDNFHEMKLKTFDSLTSCKGRNEVEVNVNVNDKGKEVYVELRRMKLLGMKRERNYIE